jgi:hypothetical protein
VPAAGEGLMLAMPATGEADAEDDINLNDNNSPRKPHLLSWWRDNHGDDGGYDVAMEFLTLIHGDLTKEAFLSFRNTPFINQGLQSKLQTAQDIYIAENDQSPPRE